MSLSSFSAFALTRAEMKNIVGGCTPPHYDVWVLNGGSSKDNLHVFCALTEDSAWRFVHKTKEFGGQMGMAYNKGTC